MTTNGDSLKPFKDAFISSVFTLTKASNDSAEALINLLNKMEEIGALSTEELASLPLSKDQLSRIGAASTKSEPVEDPSLVHDSSDSHAAPKVEHPEKKKKRQRAPADPNMPKRPLQPYLVFSNDQKRKIREERAQQDLPPLTMAEINEKVQESWKSMDADDREVLDSSYRACLKEYNESLSAYKATLEVIKPATEEDVTPATQEDKPEEPPKESSPAPQPTPKKSSRKKSSSAASESAHAESEAAAPSADEKSEPAKRKRSKKTDTKEAPERKKRTSKASKEASKDKEHEST